MSVSAITLKVSNTFQSTLSQQEHSTNIFAIAYSYVADKLLDLTLSDNVASQ